MGKRAMIVAAAVVSGVVCAPGAHAGLAEPDEAESTPGGVKPLSSGPVLQSPAVPLLRIKFDEGPASAGDALYQFKNSGSAPVHAAIVSSYGGEAVRVPRGRDDWAARLPRYSTARPAPRAVIRVRGANGSDPLDPGGRGFSFGAVWRLDDVSSGSNADNGDNLVQRGLSGDPAQFKLQVDSHLPMCTVRGGDGAVVVKAERVQARRWYRARCYRDGMHVTIRVWQLARSGVIALDSATERGSIGSLNFAAHVPLSVGGKLDGAGDPVRQSGDQFNGVVDNVVYDVHS